MIGQAILFETANTPPTRERPSIKLGWNAINAWWRRWRCTMSSSIKRRRVAMVRTNSSSNRDQADMPSWNCSDSER